MFSYAIETIGFSFSHDEHEDLAAKKDSTGDTLTLPTIILPYLRIRPRFVPRKALPLIYICIFPQLKRFKRDYEMTKCIINGDKIEGEKSFFKV